MILGAFWLAISMNATASAQSGDTIAGLPNSYVVQPGDTLWEIATVFLGDPYYWPRLWSFNEQITNPHWIYPGTVIKFTLGDDLNPFGIGSDPMQPEAQGPILTDERTFDCGPDVRFSKEWDSTIFNAPGFLENRRNIEVYGSIERAYTPFKNLAEDDLIYLRVEDPKAFECGDVVTIFRRTQKQVRHPDSRREKFGSIYSVQGEAIVVHHYGNYLSARIRESQAEIERGDLIGPPFPVNIELEIREPTGNLEGTIISKLSNITLSSDRDIVFLDRGSSDGVRQGDSFYVTDQRDPFFVEEDTSLPPSVIGRVVVLRVSENSSTAVITDSNQSIGIGYRISQYVD